MTSDRLPRPRAGRRDPLLDGSPDGDVARLLDLAARPGDTTRPAPGEHDVLLAFRGASDMPDLVPVPLTRSEPVRRRGIRTMTALKIAAVAAAVATVSGVAAAATHRVRDDRVEVVAARELPPTAPMTRPTHPPTPQPPAATSSSGRSSARSSAPSSAPSSSTTSHQPGTRAVPPAPRPPSACAVWRRWSSSARPGVLPPGLPQKVGELRACAPIVRQVCVALQRGTRPGAAPLPAVCPLARPGATTRPQGTLPPVGRSGG